MKLKVNPLFFALILVLVLFGQGLNFLFVFAALIVHELGHIIAARARGFVMKNLVLMPYGAMMSTNENFDKTSGLLIGFAGPIANFVTALVLLGVWWLVPSLYGISRPFLFANLSLGAFNLLPAYPLDGSRIMLSACKNKMRAITALRVVGIVLSLVMFVGFVASFFFEINFSLGIMAVFLFYGAAFSAKDEMYINVLDAQSKNYNLGVEKRVVKISESVPLIRFFHHISATRETTFEIVDKDGKKKLLLTEEELKEYALKHKLSRSFREIEDI